MLSRPALLTLLLCVAAHGATLKVPSRHATVATAVAASSDGDTILVSPGVYSGSIDLGERSLTILATAVTPGTALPSRESVARTVLDGDGADYALRLAAEGGPVTIRGFTIRNASDGITAERPFTLTHSRITATSDGIDFEGGGGLVEYSYFEGNTDDGIDLDGPTAAVIRHCEISDNEDDGIEVRFHPFEGDSLHTVIAHNTIARNGEDGIQFIDYETPSKRSFTIERNLIIDNAMVGIACMGESVTRESFEGDPVDERIRVVHNTLRGNPHGITGGGNLRIVNTLIADSRDVALKAESTPPTVTHCLIAGAGVPVQGLTLDSTNVVTVDARLAWDHRLRGGSPAIDRGRLLPGTSHLGKAPDIGAREYRAEEGILPVAITDSVSVDSDDPAIWIDPDDPAGSRILGTDKGGKVYVFDLQGRTVQVLQEPGMQRMNNVDVEYGLRLGDRTVDIAVATDRDAGRLFAWTLPDGESLTPDGVPVFEGEDDRRPMGLGLYRRGDGEIFAIVSRKSGESKSYLWQYHLTDDGEGGLAFQKVRAFGRFSGVNAEGDGEIEAICVDDSLGLVYYSDELAAVRVYHADPDRPYNDRQHHIFARDGFTDDREGIALARGRQTLIVVSDQGASRFRAFDQYDHRFIGSVALQTESTDGCEVYTGPLPGYPGGIFIAMSDDRTFHFYDWEEVRQGLLRGQ